MVWIGYIQSLIPQLDFDNGRNIGIQPPIFLYPFCADFRVLPDLIHAIKESRYILLRRDADLIRNRIVVKKFLCPRVRIDIEKYWH